MEGARFDSEIVAIDSLSPSVRRLWLRRVDGRACEFSPGQHVELAPMAADGTVSSGAYSLCEPPSRDGRYAICVKRVAGSECAAALMRCDVGEVLATEGPRGPFVLDETEAVDLLLIATGSGVTPFHAMIEQLRRWARARRVWLFLGARRPNELLYHDDWEAISREVPRFRYHPIVSQPHSEDSWQGAIGRVGKLLPDVVSSAEVPVVVYLCGQPAMVRDMSAALQRRGVPADMIRYEQ